MPRFFTLQQAERFLPEVESAVRQAIPLKAEFQEAEQEWQLFLRRIAFLGGLQVDHAQVGERKQRRDSAAVLLKSALEKIQECGCLIKDLDIGLVDFPTLYRGEEVYLCWKLGESGIHFWHGVHEGFRGRKPIDQEFVEQHQAE